MSARREKRLRRLEARIDVLEKSALPLIAYWKDRALQSERMDTGAMDADYTPVTTPSRSLWQRNVDIFRKDR